MKFLIKLLEIGDISSPMEIRYMKQVSSSLDIIGAWPHMEFDDRNVSTKVKFYYNKILFLVSILTLITVILFLKIHSKELTILELGHIYITVFINVVGVQRLSVSWFQIFIQVTKRFVLHVHLFHYKDKSEYALKIHKQIHKLSTIFTLLLHYQMYMGIVLFNLTPLYNNFQSGMFSPNKPENGTYEHSVYYELPFDYRRQFRSYICVFTFNWFMSCACSISFCIYDLYLSLIVFHIWGHLKILKYNLENFPRPKSRNGESNFFENPPWYTKEEMVKVTQMLTDNINHHRMIIEFMSKTSKAFGPMLCLYYVFHQVSGCILLLECSKLDTGALVKYGPLTLILFQQLIQISIIFELLGSKSETLKDAVYSLPWECMDTNSRKIIYIFLQNVQTPISLKAADIVPVGVQTMAAILKTSYSYFIMLRTTTSSNY